MISHHQQLNSHDPDNGIYGDCFRTVIACLMNVAPDEVPHVCDGPSAPGEADEKMQGWLRERGYLMIGCAFYGSAALDDVLTAGKHASAGLHWMLSGESRNGCNHVVICLEDKIVHDTSKDQSGIVGPQSDGMYRVEWLVRPAPCDMHAVSP